MLRRNGALRIALLYTILGILWIALSDRIVFLLYGPEQTPFIHFVSSAKGFGFVLLTGLLLYNLIRSNDKRILTTERQSQKKLLASNEELNKLNSELNEQKRSLSEVQTIAKLGGWEYYPASQKMIRSDEIYYILDFAYPGEPDPAKNLIDHIHPEDREKFSTWQYELNVNNIPIDNSFRIINDSGQIKYLHMVAEPVLRNGIAYRVKGSLQDVTTSKQMEQERNEKDILLQRALERYDLVARATNDMFYDYDIPNNILTYSRDFDGVTNPIFLNEPDPTKAWFAIIHPDDLEKVIEANKNCIRKKENIYQCEYRVNFGINDYKYVCDQAYIQYKDDIAIRMIGSIRDINDLKQTAEENKRLSDVISKINNMVMITDTQRRILWVNRAFEEVSGFLLTEISGKKPYDVIGAADPDNALIADINQRSANQEIFSKELPFYTRQKDLLWAYADFTPIYNDTDEHIGYTTVYSDISILKEKEASLVSQNKALREIAWLESHEMRRPLSSILGLVELLRMSNDEAEKKELFRLLDICAKELDSMVLQISQRIQKVVSK